MWLWGGGEREGERPVIGCHSLITWLVPIALSLNNTMLSAENWQTTSSASTHWIENGVIHTVLGFDFLLMEEGPSWSSISFILNFLVMVVLLVPDFFHPQILKFLKSLHNDVHYNIFICLTYIFHKPYVLFDKTPTPFIYFLITKICFRF